VEVELLPAGNDRWRGHHTPDAVGAWSMTLHGMVDTYGTWLRDLILRSDAGQDIDLELEEGRLMVEARAARRGLSPRDAGELQLLAAALHQMNRPAARLRAARAARAVALMRRTVDRAGAAAAGPYPLWVDRTLAGFSAWYEMFPRSEGAADSRSGTFKTATARLKAIATMGFDIVYLPPIHPIGSAYRKGPNNSLTAGAADVGSPWAIGGPEGGHKAVHPDLGSLADFDAFVAAASRQKLEVALDFAVQCSPDHPWVTEHPDWFKHRPDGSIRYAENPPKRYQDIYPIDFDTADRDGLWEALRDVVDHWIAHGVRVFRVDNPHTKSFDFWQWLIDGVHGEHPDVIFLSEAFTRPRVMERLAKVGFTQSYTYFTWRNTKAELTEYLTELSTGQAVDYLRPNFWVNTPDILHEYLVAGGPPAFGVRLVLAALTCASWGMYSGFELFENKPVKPGSEEYLDSEKYQLRPRAWDPAAGLTPMVTRVNATRRRHAEAIALMRTLRLHHVDNDAILCVSRQDQAGADTLLVVVNLDAFNVREATVWLDDASLGLDPAAPLQLVDELDGRAYRWTAGGNYVRLDPAKAPAHVFALRPAGKR
jgi:starch synthase (maltosyl-transferring)